MKRKRCPVALFGGSKPPLGACGDASSSTLPHWISLLFALTACNRGAAPPIPPTVLSEAHVQAGGVAPAAGSLKNPFAGDHASADEGAKVFTSMNCDGCHGGGATGWVGPSLVDGRWRYGGSDGEIYLSIYYGRPRGMPAYGGILSGDPIWKIVTYLRAQPQPADVPTESWPGRP